MSEVLVSLGRRVLTTPFVSLISAPATAAGGGSGSGSGGGGSSGLSGVAFAGTGQSNAAYANDVDGALLAMVTAASTYLGAAGTPATLSGSATDVGGTGVDCGVSGYGSMLVYSDSTSGASTAALTSTGAGVLAYISGLTNAQRAACQAIVSYWGENDATLTAFGGGNGGLAYADKAVLVAAYLNYFGRMRAGFGKTAAELPILIFGPPYGTAQGSAMVREAWAQLAANPTNNFVWLVQQTYDTISRSDTWNSATGVASGGNTDGGHRSSVDNVALYRRGALAAARAVLAANGLNASLIPSSLGTGMGPQITAAHLSGTSLTLTITHDGGNDLIVPLLAAQGVGFSVMDGGNPGSPGNIIQATACARVDSTHLLVTLASAPSNAASACRLMYPWPGETWSVQPDTEIGRGCAVTDNFGAVSKPSGFDLNAILGAGWAANMPLCSPVSFASSVATFGIPLS